MACVRKPRKPLRDRPAHPLPVDLVLVLYHHLSPSPSSQSPVPTMVTVSVTAVCSHLPSLKMSLLPQGYNPGTLAGSVRPCVTRAQHWMAPLLRETHSSFPAPRLSCAPASSLGLSFSRKPPLAITSFLDLHQLLGLAACGSPSLQLTETRATVFTV